MGYDNYAVLGEMEICFDGMCPDIYNIQLRGEIIGIVEMEERITTCDSILNGKEI